MTEPNAPIFIAGEGDTLNLGSDTYDPGDFQKIDRAIRHMPGVVAYITQKAQQAVTMTGSDNFEVVVQNDPETQRPRAYAAPSNNQGVHEELSEGLLLKAAANMEGQ